MPLGSSSSVLPRAQSGESMGNLDEGGGYTLVSLMGGGLWRCKNASVAASQKGKSDTERSEAEGERNGGDCRI